MFDSELVKQLRSEIDYLRAENAKLREEQKEDRRAVLVLADRRSLTDLEWAKKELQPGDREKVGKYKVAHDRPPSAFDNALNGQGHTDEDDRDDPALIDDETPPEYDGADAGELPAESAGEVVGARR